jgi:predicted DNA-binding ribbon-helix-helix protein
VALTLRLERKDWARLHEVAVADGLALADLLREGLNRALAARGLPPVDV